MGHRLTTFTITPVCPKCGHISITYEHAPARKSCTTYLGSPLSDTEEHLTLTCTTCKYEWGMEVQDIDTDELPF